MTGDLNGSEPKMHAAVEMVTPAKATAWLQNAAKNRNISPFNVRRYGADMLAGRWKLNGQGVIFDENGQLVDGRHRLTAIVNTGCEIAMLVVRGAKEEAFETMDAGRARSLPNVLAMQGHKNVTSTSATARMVWAYAAGTNLKYGTTRIELLNLIRAHPLIEEYTSLILNRDYLTKPMGVPRSALAAVLVLANEDRAHDTGVTEFVDGFVTGEGLFGGDPRLTLRRWLTRQRQETGVGGTRIAEPFFAATTRAWSAFIEQRELALVRLPLFMNRETMPLTGYDQALWGDVPDMSRASFSGLGGDRKINDPDLARWENLGRKGDDDPAPDQP